MRKHGQLPIALTVAGSDSGGGAGVQADLKTFAALQVHGTSVITCLTAQNPKRISAVEPASPGIVQRQLEAVFDALPPAAVKIGMLYSPAIARAVVAFFRPAARPFLVIDPVMVSTSGAELLKPAASRILREQLLPLATLVMPNLPEVEILTGTKLSSVEDLRRAARMLHEQFGCAALVKGGHLTGSNEAVDVFWDGSKELLLRAPFVRGVKTHGTGCTYSAAVTAFLARKFTLPQAVRRAKEFITQAIVRSQSAGGYSVLNSFWAASFSPSGRERRG